MSDLFNNNTANSATQWGVFAFFDTYSQGPSSSYFYKNESVGASGISSDTYDYFTFYAYQLESITVSFTSNRTSDYINGIHVSPVEGVTAINGDVLGLWTGGIFANLWQQAGLTNGQSINSVAGGIDNFAQYLGAADVLETAENFKNSTIALNDFPDASATWTIDNSKADANGLVKVTFAVTGYELTADSSGNPSDIGEVNYRVSVSPLSRTAQL